MLSFKYFLYLCKQMMHDSAKRMENVQKIINIKY